MCVAYPVDSERAGATPVLRYASFPLSSQDSTLHATCRYMIHSAAHSVYTTAALIWYASLALLRMVLVSLMGRSRVITYGGQELISALLSNFDDIPPNGIATINSCLRFFFFPCSMEGVVPPRHWPGGVAAGPGQPVQLVLRAAGQAWSAAAGPAPLYPGPT